MNCLVTKLSSSVNDNNLPFFGAVKVRVNNNVSASKGSNSVRINAVGDIRIIGDGFFANESLISDGTKLKHIESESAISFVNGEYIVLIPTSVVMLTNIPGESSTIKSFSFNINDLDECLQIGSIGTNGTKCNGVFRDLIEAQIELGRNSGNISLVGNGMVYVEEGAIASTGASYVANIVSGTEYSIKYPSKTDTFKKINGVWVKQ